MTAPAIFLPGSTIGVMGSGQLGRMLSMAAHRMGYRVHIFSPERDTPAGQVSDLEITAPYEDRQAVEAFAAGVDLVTFEFENIPAETVRWCEERSVVRPGVNVLHTCQHRLREKQFLQNAGLPLPPFAPVSSLEELQAAVARIGYPAVLKTAAFGYDGRGQQKLTTEADVAKAWAAFAGQPAVLEGWVSYEAEVSILVARGPGGDTATYPLCENQHRNHILDLTLVPARVPSEVEAAAKRIALRIAESLDLVGLLAVEMFLLPGGELLVNELAPRPHNSGHFSFDASVTSQFEQQIRAVCGLPLGSTETLRPCAMANLLGDVWSGGEPRWTAALAMPEVKLHLYGKGDPRPGRKMGHLVAFGTDSTSAGESALQARSLLQGS